VRCCLGLQAVRCCLGLQAVRWSWLKHVLQLSFVLVHPVLVHVLVDVLLLVHAHVLC